MFHLEYLAPGKDVGFQLSIDGESLTYAGKVYDRDDKTLSIEINDEGLNQKQISRGKRALLLGEHDEEKISLPVRIENPDTLPILRIREHNSRSYFRVDGFIKLKYMKILGEEYVRIREQYLNGTDPEDHTAHSDTNNNYGHEIGANKNAIPLKLVNQICLLHKQIHFLQELMTNSEEAGLLEQESVKINLSGSGMRFASTDPLKVGDLLDMKMLLPTSPFSIIRTIALVVRVDKTPKKELSSDERANTLAVKFIVIHEYDRDCIIRCIFSWQRQMLRQRQIVH